MAASKPLPTHGAQYTITIPSDPPNLSLHPSEALSPIHPKQCLIHIEAISLNYRDIAMPLNLYPASTKPEVIPCSDCCGTILAIGDDVSEFAVGDRVCTTFFQDHVSGYLTAKGKRSSLGGLNDGVLRQYAIFPERGIVGAPRNLSAIEAATLPCAAVTAWNALFGLEGRKVKKGDWVLTQGSGGVSMFAILFAKAVGARVVGTTSSRSKEERLRALGVDQAVNYREVKEWGDAVRGIVGEEGCRCVVEVGGEQTMKESLKAVAIEGVISIVGFLGGGKKDTEIGFWDCFKSTCIVRGVNVGSREQFEAMNRFIEEHNIKPVVDEKVFEFEQAKEAYQYLLDQKFFGKVVMKGAGA